MIFIIKMEDKMTFKNYDRIDYLQVMSEGHWMEDLYQPMSLRELPQTLLGTIVAVEPIQMLKHIG